jgi:hypothetical protein
MSDKIICRINDTPKIIVKFGDQGLMGPMGPTGPVGPGGTTNHALLTNLEYDHANHVGFQKALTYIPEYKAYELES